MRDFLPNNELVNFLASTVCDEATRFLCADILFVLAGFDLKQLNEVSIFLKIKLILPYSNMP